MHFSSFVCREVILYLIFGWNVALFAIININELIRHYYRYNIMRHTSDNLHPLCKFTDNKIPVLLKTLFEYMAHWIPWAP